MAVQYMYPTEVVIRSRKYSYPNIAVTYPVSNGYWIDNTGASGLHFDTDQGGVVSSDLAMKIDEGLLSVNYNDWYDTVTPTHGIEYKFMTPLTVGPGNRLGYESNIDTSLSFRLRASGVGVWPSDSESESAEIPLVQTNMSRRLVVQAFLISENLFTARNIGVRTIDNPFISGLNTLSVEFIYNLNNIYHDRFVDAVSEIGLNNAGVIIKVLALDYPTTSTYSPYTGTLCQTDFACDLIVTGHEIPPVTYDTYYNYRSSPQLYMSGPSAADNKPSGLPLYMSGPLPYSGKNTLYLGGQYPSGITNLYTQGPLPFDNLPSGTSLFIEGHEQTETGIPLFIAGHENYYSGCDLYLEAGKINDNITLFLDGLDPVSINKNMNLAIWADGSNGLGNTSKYTTLFMESRGKTSGEIPLFIEGGNFDTRSSNIPLYMNTDGSDQQSTVLTVFNEQLTKFTETTLFTNSAIRHSGNATLFMDAPHSGEQKNSIPFYMNNDQFRTDDVQLTVYNDTSYGESGKTLFLANFVPYDNNIPLFMGVIASGEHNSDIPFYMNNNQFKSSGTSLLLYHELYEPSGVNIPLFISNFDSYSGAVPLFMGVIASGDYNSSIPLHTTCGGYKDDTTDLYISNYQLSQSGKTSLFTTSFWSSNGNAPLFIEGPAAGDILKTIPLYVKTTEISYYNTVSGRRPLPMTIWNNQLTGSRVMDLYIGRSTSDSANIPLVIQGGGIDDRTNTTDLYLHSRVESSGDVPLSLLTGVNIKSIPLVMTGLDPAKDQSGIPLFTYSANNSGIFSTNELFLKSDVFGKTIPLFMNVVEVGYPISNIPLYINNDSEHKMSMSVFLESVRWTSGTQNLFINGLGLQPGAEVSRENISMFLAREVDSASYSMYMHLAAPSGESQVIPMLLEGGTYSQLETTLFLPEAMGNEGSGMSMYSHGF